VSVTHIASDRITIGDQYMRQRCGWCGEVLVEYNLVRVAVPAGTDPAPAAWPPGALVTVDGHASWTVDGNQLPEDSCARNPLTLASLT
jgi:hypothetical protein